MPIRVDDRIRVERAPSPIEIIEIALEPWENNSIEKKEPPTVTIKPNVQEAETFELRADGGRQILNKGQCATIALAMLELAGYEVTENRNGITAKKVYGR